MTNKEYILDCLADGGEAKTQIIEFFAFLKINIGSSEIDDLIQEMLEEDLITTDKTWVNEFGENPYIMTPQGKKLWNERVKNTNDF